MALSSLRSEHRTWAHCCRGFNDSVSAQQLLVPLLQQYFLGEKTSGRKFSVGRL
jgi:hypothetical protein